MIVFIDFETHLISDDTPIPKPICISFYDGNKDGILIGQDIEDFLTRIFKDEHIKIGAHNAAFELNVITKYYPNLKPFLYKKLNNKKIICTKIYEQLLDCVRKHPIGIFNLAALVLKYFNIDISEDKKNPNAWRLRYHELENVPLCDWPKEAINYAKYDSIYAYDIYKNQLLEADIDISLSVSADYYLNRMGSTGILIEQTRVSTIEEELKNQISVHKEILQKHEILIQDKKGLKRNMKAFKALLKKKLPNIRYTAKGSISTSNEDLNHYLTLISKNDYLYSLLNSFLNIMSVEKVLTAFTSRLKKATPYIRTQYNAVVSSGRTSSFTSDNFASVNIQQMPREIREII